MTNKSRVEIPEDTIGSKMPQMKDFKNRTEDLVLIATAIKDIAWQCDQIYSQAIESIHDNLDSVVEHQRLALRLIRELTESLRLYMLAEDWEVEKDKMVKNITFGPLVSSYIKSNKIKVAVGVAVVIVLLPFLQNVAQALLVGLGKKVFFVDLTKILPLLFRGG